MTEPSAWDVQGVLSWLQERGLADLTDAFEGTLYMH